MTGSAAKAVFLFLLLAAALHIAYYYPLLPDTVASHFGASGKADGWSSKQSFFGIYGGIVLLMAFTFYGIAMAVPRLPASMINLSNKDYWLAPERQEETFAAVTHCLLWLGNATIAFLVAIMHLTIRVNLGESPALGGTFWVLLGLYLLITLAGAGWLIVRFRKIPE